MTIFSDLVLLKAFVTIVESGSISAAARRLNLAQPTLSRRLQTLEDQYGGVLLRRDTHRMHLTDAGHRFLDDAKALLTMADEAEQRLRSDQTALEGNIRIFATIDFAQSVVSRLIASFIQAHPAVTIHLSYTNRPLTMIEEGCDAGVIAGALTDDGVVARSLGEIKRYPVAAPVYLETRKHASKPKDIEGWAWLALGGTQFGGAREVILYSGKAERSFRIDPVMIAEGVSSLREEARMGLGVAVLPAWLIEEDIVCGRLTRVLPSWSAKELSAHVVYPAQRRLSLRVRTFIDFATSYMSTVLAQNYHSGPRPAVSSLRGTLNSPPSQT